MLIFIVFPSVPLTADGGRAPPDGGTGMGTVIDDETVERAAANMYGELARANGWFYTSWDGLSDLTRQVWLKAARLGLEAALTGGEARP